MNAAKTNPNTDKIGKHAQGAKNLNKSSASSASLASLGRRIDALEEAVEEVGKTSELRKDVQKYVKHLEKELEDIIWFRALVTGIAIVFSIGLFGFFCFLIIFQPCWFSELKGNIKIPFLATLSIMSVLLISLCLRGVYQTRKERNYGDFTPESIKIAMKALGDST